MSCASPSLLYGTAADGSRWVTPHRRPGILVLVNDTDWELEGELEYKLQEKDSIMFISSASPLSSVQLRSGR